MPPKKKVSFNANVDIKYIPAQGRGRRVSPRRPIPIPPPLPPLHPPTRFLSTPSSSRPPRPRPLTRYAGIDNLSNPSASPVRPPRPRPLRRYAGMKNVTKIPKQKGGAFTREMGKKLFLDKLTRPSRPSVTKTSKLKKKPKKHRETKNVATKRMQQYQKLRNLAHPSMRAAKVLAKKKLKEYRTLRNLNKLNRARQLQKGPTRVAKNKRFLDAVQQVEEKHRKKLIKNATPEQINTISEVALNILQGNIPLKEHHKKKLNKHKKSLRALASKGVSVKNRKKIINQHGGMIGAAASALGEYTYDNIKKYNKEYSDFCTKEKLKQKIPCKFAPKDYNTAAYRRKHNDNVKCTIL